MPFLENFYKSIKKKTPTKKIIAANFPVLLFLNKKNILPLQLD